MALHFMNAGEFDVRAMLTFGVNAKESESAIGYFGTGFKYAVAIILRLGGKISVSTKGKTYEFTKQKDAIRGKEFDFVLVNGNDCGITTRLGINWEPWMALRELYCNCKDENGEISESKSSAFDTCVSIDCAPVEAAWRERSDFFLEGEPIATTREVDIHDKPAKYFYYRGIAVKMMPRASRFTYNLKSTVDLTEDRLARYDYQLEYPVKRALQNSSDRNICLAAASAHPDTFEGRLAYDPDYGASEVFIDVLRENLNTARGIPETLRLLLSRLDEKRGRWSEFAPTAVQSAMIERSLSFLERLDINPRQFPIKCVDSLGSGVMGRALDGSIYISKLAFNQGTKQVASTLMEEWVHCSHGHEDFDRGMQNWLFDKILSLGEEIAGEPL